MMAGTIYATCEYQLNISAAEVIVEGGNLMGPTNIWANNAYISNLIVTGNLNIICNY